MSNINRGNYMIDRRLSAGIKIPTSVPRRSNSVPNANTKGMDFAFSTKPSDNLPARKSKVPLAKSVQIKLAKNQEVIKMKRKAIQEMEAKRNASMYW